MASKNDNSLVSRNKGKPVQERLELFTLDEMLDANYSNILEIYDLAGKFVYDKERKYQAKASAEESVFTRKTTYQEQEVTLTVTSALIERSEKGKKKRVFTFPGAREEIIEDVLRKFATENRAETFEVSEGENKGATLVGVSFTIYDVYVELDRVGKKYSYDEISEALDIMAKAHLDIESEDGAINLSAPFFPFLATAQRGDKKDRQNFVAFHPMVTQTILSLNYRRHNYAQALSFNRHYTRLVYKRLCLRWIRATEGQTYTILLSTLIDAIKEPYKNLYQDKQLMISVFDDLINAEVLEKYEATPKKDPQNKRKVLDWRFDLYPTKKFSKQIAANNKVAKRNREKLEGNADKSKLIEH